MTREVMPLETILLRLTSDNWLEAGTAINKLIPHGEAATVALPLLFQLTVLDKPPVRSDSYRVIKGLGKHAVPFLLEQVINKCPDLRAMAICLLMETGFREATSTLVFEQVLRPRYSELPDWGVDPEELIQHFRTALSDNALEVRFWAASALEEFGRHIPETIPVFIEALKDGSIRQQHLAALHLGRIGPAAAAAKLELELAIDECESTALAARNALERINPVDAE